MKVFKMISDIKIGNIFLPNTNVVILISQMLSVACKIKCCQSAIGSSHILKTSVWRPKNNKSSKLISRQVYCSRLCGSWLISCNKLCLIISNNTLKLNYKVFEWLWLQTDAHYCSRRQMWILVHPDQCLLLQSPDKLKKK